MRHSQSLSTNTSTFMPYSLTHSQAVTAFFTRNSDWREDFDVIRVLSSWFLNRLLPPVKCNSENELNTHTVPMKATDETSKRVTMTGETGDSDRWNRWPVKTGETGDGDRWRPVKPVTVTGEDRWNRWRWTVKTGETGDGERWRPVKPVTVTGTTVTGNDRWNGDGITVTNRHRCIPSMSMFVSKVWWKKEERKNVENKNNTNVDG